MKKNMLLIIFVIKINNIDVVNNVLIVVHIVKNYMDMVDSTKLIHIEIKIIMYIYIVQIKIKQKLK